MPVFGVLCHQKIVAALHCLEDPMDGGAWCAAVYGVTQSQTRLKRLSSSSSSSSIGRWGTLVPVALKVTELGQGASPSPGTPLDSRNHYVVGCVCVCVCVGKGLWEKSLKIVYDQSGDRA